MIIVRGAGDLATGTIYELHKAGYRVLALNVQDRRRFEEKLPSVRRSMTE